MPGSKRKRPLGSSLLEGRAQKAPRGSGVVDATSAADAGAVSGQHGADQARSASPNEVTSSSRSVETLRLHHANMREEAATLHGLFEQLVPDALRGSAWVLNVNLASMGREQRPQVEQLRRLRQELVTASQALNEGLRDISEARIFALAVFLGNNQIGKSSIVSMVVGKPLPVGKGWKSVTAKDVEFRHRSEPGYTVSFPARALNDLYDQIKQKAAMFRGMCADGGGVVVEAAKVPKAFKGSAEGPAGATGAQGAGDEGCKTPTYYTLWLKWFIPGHEDFHDFTAIPKNIQNLLLNDPAELLNHPELAGVKRDIEYVAAHTDPATRRFSVTVNSWKEVEELLHKFAMETPGARCVLGPIAVGCSGVENLQTLALRDTPGCNDNSPLISHDVVDTAVRGEFDHVVLCLLPYEATSRARDDFANMYKRMRDEFDRDPAEALIINVTQAEKVIQSDDEEKAGFIKDVERNLRQALIDSAVVQGSDVNTTPLPRIVLTTSWMPNGEASLLQLLMERGVQKVERAYNQAVEDCRTLAERFVRLEELAYDAQNKVADMRGDFVPAELLEASPHVAQAFTDTVRARLGAAVRRYLAGVRVATAGLANGDVLWNTVAAAISGKGDRDVVIALDREGEHSRADWSRQPVDINMAVQYSLVHNECVQHWEDLKKALADLEHNLFTKLEDLPAQWLEAVLARGGLSGEIEADLRELIDPNSIDVPTRQLKKRLWEISKRTYLAEAMKAVADAVPDHFGRAVCRRAADECRGRPGVTQATLVRFKHLTKTIGGELQIAVLSGIKAVVGKMSTTYQRAVDGFVSDRLAYLESRLSTAFEYRALPSGPGDGSARKRRKTLNSIRSSWSTLQESLVRIHRNPKATIIERRSAAGLTLEQLLAQGGDFQDHKILPLHIKGAARKYIQHMVKKPEGVVILRSEFVHDFCSRVKPGLRAEIPNSVNGYLTGLLDNVVQQDKTMQAFQFPGVHFIKNSKTKRIYMWHF